MNFSLRTEGRLSTDYLLSALSYRHQQDKTGNMQLFAGEAIAIVLTCVFVAIRGQCPLFEDQKGRWVDYSPTVAPVSPLVNSTAYFVCSGELGLAGPSEQTCTSSRWSGESHCTKNVAEGKTATQHSIYSDDGHPENAVDGRREGYWFNQSCAGTLWATDPWWNVDLGGSYRVGSIHVYNRIEAATSDRLLGAQILAGNEDDPLTNDVIGTVEYEELRTNPIIFTLDKLVTDVSIRVPGSDKMVTVCEVEVYGMLLNSEKEASN